MIKPIHKMYVYVILFQALAYALIFYIFETISKTDQPTRFMIFWIPVALSVFVSYWLVKAMSNRIKINGVKKINYKQYIVSGIRKVQPPLRSMAELKKEIEKDGILTDCILEEESEHVLKLTIRYSFFLEEIIYIDFEQHQLRLCAKPSIWYIYGPYGGGIQKLGYLESIIQNHYNLSHVEETHTRTM